MQRSTALVEKDVAQQKATVKGESGVRSLRPISPNDISLVCNPFILHDRATSFVGRRHRALRGRGRIFYITLLMAGMPFT